MVETFCVILGFALCALPAWYVLRAQEQRYKTLRADFRHLVNEFSLRTGGRRVFREEKKVSRETQNSDTLGDDKFGIFLPSMAEEMAEAEDERMEDSQMTDADLEHLRKTRVIQ